MDNEKKPRHEFKSPLLRRGVHKGTIPASGISRKFKMKRVPRPSPYVEMDLRKQYALETHRSISQCEEHQILALEMTYGGPNWDGAGEEEVDA